MGFYKSRNSDIRINQEGVKDAFLKLKNIFFKDTIARYESFKARLDNIQKLDPAKIDQAAKKHLAKYSFGSITIPNGYNVLLTNLTKALDNADKKEDLFNGIIDATIPNEIKSELSAKLNDIYGNKYDYKILGVVGSKMPSALILPKPKKSTGLISLLTKNLYFRVKLVKLTPINNIDIKISLNSAKTLLEDYKNICTNFDKLISKYNDIVIMTPDFMYATITNEISLDSKAIMPTVIKSFINYVDAYISVCEAAKIGINQESENTELSSNLDPELAAQDLQDAAQEINNAIDATDELQAVNDRLESEEPATTDDTIEDVVEQDITNSEYQETSKDLEDAIETSNELESVGSEVQEELDAVNERLESEEPIDPVDVTVVNESIQHYSKLLGLTRENTNLSLEDVRNNSRESMEGLKLELEGIGEKIKEYAKKAWKKNNRIAKEIYGVFI